MAAAAIATVAVPVAAQAPQFFRIGTGGTAGTYYPIGGLIANAISNAPGSRGCADGGSCGVPGLIATAVSSNGSVANINALNGGALESGFTQSDVATWAHSGTGVWDGQPAVEKLRAIANLYPETIHLVAAAGSGIDSVDDLARWLLRDLRLPNWEEKLPVVLPVVILLHGSDGPKSLSVVMWRNILEEMGAATFRLDCVSPAQLNWASGLPTRRSSAAAGCSTTSCAYLPPWRS